MEQGKENATAETTKNSGVLFSLSGIMILLFTTAPEAVYIGYSVMKDTISALGFACSPTGSFWDLNSLLQAFSG